MAKVRDVVAEISNGTLHCPLLGNVFQFNG
jgi:hypothetical protein